MFPRTEHLTVVLAALGLASARSLNVRRGQQNMIPKFSYAPDTVKYCGWWLDNDGTWTCPKIEETFELSMTDFQRWVRRRMRNIAAFFPQAELTIPRTRRYPSHATLSLATSHSVSQPAKGA